MTAREIRIGNATVFVSPAQGGDVPTIGGTVETSSRGLPSIDEVLAKAATGLGETIKKMARELTPDEIEVELKLGVEEGCDVWFANVKGEQAITVTMKWTSLRKA